jgi:hypothetical protein
LIDDTTNGYLYRETSLVSMSSHICTKSLPDKLETLTLRVKAIKFIENNLEEFGRDSFKKTNYRKH